MVGASQPFSGASQFYSCICGDHCNFGTPLKPTIGRIGPHCACAFTVYKLQISKHEIENVPSRRAIARTVPERLSSEEEKLHEWQRQDRLG